MIGRALRNMAVERRGIAPSTEFTDSSIPPWAASNYGSNTGVPVTEAATLGLATAYACVRVLVNVVSTLPILTYKGFGPAKRLVDAPPLIESPYAWLSTTDFIAQAMYSTVMRGNFYGQIVETDALGFPTQIMPLHPDAVTVRTRNGGPEYRIRGKLVDDPDTIFHIRGPIQSPGSFTGIGPLEACRQSFGIGIAADQYAGAFYGNSAQPGGFISYPGNLTQPKAVQLAEQWLQGHQGTAKAHLPGVLTEGATWTPLSFSPEASQLLLSRQWSAAEIASIFGVPAHLAASTQDKSTTWGAGLEVAQRVFVATTVAGYLVRLEKALSDCLPRKTNVRFDLQELYRGDLATRTAANAMAVQAGLMSPNEARAYEDRPPYEGGDDFVRPLNIAPIDPKSLLAPQQPSTSSPSQAGPAAGAGDSIGGIDA